MKYSLLVVLLTTSFLSVQAQETDSIEENLEEALENTNTETTEEYDESSEYTEEESAEYESSTAEESTPAHTLVNPADVSSTVEYKNEEISIHKFDREKWREIVGATNYTEKETIVERKKQPESHDEDERLPWAGSWLRFLSYLVIGIVLFFLLYFVFRDTSFDFKQKKKIVLEADLSAPVQNIEDIDNHALLKQYLADSNFRMAVRLYYLGLLKKLHELGIIHWKKDKTNRDYLSELFFRDYHFDEIKRLTLAYEEIWYG